MQCCRHGFLKCADEEVGRRAVGFLQFPMEIFNHSSWIVVVVRSLFETIEESLNYSRSSHKYKNLPNFNGRDGLALSEPLQPGLSPVSCRDDADNIYSERQTKSQFDEHWEERSLSLFSRSETLGRVVRIEGVYAFVNSPVLVLSCMMHLLLISWEKNF
jgi:hypothetical protein